MGFFKKLFGGKEETPEEEHKEKVEKDFDVLKYDGVTALKTRNTEYAIQCFKAALQRKDDLETRDYLSQAYIQNNELLPAYDELQKLADAQPDNKQIFVRMAHVAFLMEDYNAMSVACEKAKLIDKDDAQVNYFYAKACLGQNDLINAIAMLTKAITVADQHKEEESEEAQKNAAFLPAMYLLRGETLLKMGDVKSADEDATLLLDMTDSELTDAEDIYLLKARVEHAKQQLDEAITYYNKVIEANPFSIDAFRERGAVYLEKGDKIHATEDAEHLLELNPNEAKAVNGDYKAEGTEDIQQKMEQTYKNNNPYGF